MLLDILDNLPRLRVSSSQLRLILWMMTELGIRDVPSYDAFREVQKGLTAVCGSKPKQCESSIGNIFYVNAIQDSIARVHLKFHELLIRGA